MPASLDAADRRLLIGAGLVLLVLIAISVLISPPAEPLVGIPSSYSPAWDGAKATFMMLKDLGYQVERWEQSPATIPYRPSETVLIVAEPFPPPTTEERQAIHRFVRAGGILLATGAASEVAPEAATEQSFDPRDREWKQYHALLPSPLARDATEIVMAATSHWKSARLLPLTIFGDGTQAAVVAYGYGQGSVIWWAAPTPLTNGGIREKDNLALLLNALGPARERRILWDEYHHGAGGSLWSYFGRTPLPWFAVQVTLFLLAAFATFSRRSAPARAPAPESRLSPLEFVETLGDLYRAAHAGPAAVGIAYERLRFVLAQGLALPSKAALSEVARRAAERLGWNESPLLATLTRAERAMRSSELPDAQALLIVQELHDYAARLERNGSSAPEHGQ